MKTHLTELVRNIQAEGHNIAEQPIIFKWEWPDDIPGVGFQLLIHGSTPEAENSPDDGEEVIIVATPDEKITVH